MLYTLVFIGILSLAQGQNLWSPVRMEFLGPQANEGDVTINPFLDLRLTLHLTTPSGSNVEIPGFFDGDGAGGGSGAVWRARWLPNEIGP